MRMQVVLALAFVMAASLVSEVALYGQESGDYRRGTMAEKVQGLTLDRSSWIYTPLLPPREIRVHDIISIRVQEGATMTAEGEVQRRKNASYNAVLLDWLRLDGLSLKPAAQADGDPTAKGQVDQLYRANNEVETKESLTFNIAAQVVDIRPNGNLVVEAHRMVRNNNEIWEYSLTGICRKEDVGPGNVVLSRDIADLLVDKNERGHVRDGYRRGWLVRLIDTFNPF